MTSRNSTCWCKSGKKWKHCHAPEKAPQSFEEQQDDYLKKYQILLKSPEQIEGIRQSAKCASHILKTLCDHAKEGVTTEEINTLSIQLHKEANAKPAPLGYGSPPFPGTICTSLNDVICHGIPDNTPLKNGDIINIDVTTILNGFYGDCSAMVCIGSVSEEKQHVVDVSHKSLMKAINILKPGVLICEIGEVIEQYAHSKNCSVVHQFVAHGVGLHFHEPPQIPHHRNRINIPMTAGMIFTIEPMINAGKAEGIIDSKDQWTARTYDGKASAQWEHTLLITEHGYEILTQ